ncbi:hypothetical protein F5B18DRAFT_67379 [Nemania serpens]|nr:hypothetical protein F5B18DRAFT_67379 [Nemania serpens]
MPPTPASQNNRKGREKNKSRHSRHGTVWPIYIINVQFTVLCFACVFYSMSIIGLFCLEGDTNYFCIRRGVTESSSVAVGPRGVTVANAIYYILHRDTQHGTTICPARMASRGVLSRNAGQKFLVVWGSVLPASLISPSCSLRQRVRRSISCAQTMD